MENLLFLHEESSFRLARYLRRKFGKKLGCDEKSLILFFKTMRLVFSFYKDVDEHSVLIGVEFCMAEDEKGETSLVSNLVLNNQAMIEFKNKPLIEAVSRMFSPKLIKDKRMLIHWNTVEEFEAKARVSKEEATKIER